MRTGMLPGGNGLGTTVSLVGAAMALFPICAIAQGPAGASYTGPGSCAASACHGSVRRVAGSRILQTEYSTWIVRDKHAKATEVLTNSVSLRMARILELPRPDTAPKCLACHALDVPDPQKARSFAAEGVSCEVCHGPASGWLGPHTTRGWTHAQSVQAGMYDTKDLVKRTERCTSCHVGTADKMVDHEMIAAGHPDLVFDLEAFSSAMPRHWQEPPASDPWRGVTAWTVGQITELQAGLERLRLRAKGPVWPEYAELDCMSCHHSLTRPEDSWRQELGYQNRRSGNPPWNHSRSVVAQLIVRDLDPAAAGRLEADVARLAAEVSKLQADRNRVAEISAGLQTVLSGVASRAAATPADAAAARRFMRAIVDDAERIANAGERSAEQAAMSLDVLFSAYSRNERDIDGAAMRAALNGLFQQLENPSAYDPRRAVAQLKQVGELLR